MIVFEFSCFAIKIIFAYIDISVKIYQSIWQNRDMEIPCLEYLLYDYRMNNMTTDFYYMAVLFVVSPV